MGKCMWQRRLARTLVIVGFPFVTGVITRGLQPASSSAISSEQRPLSATVWATIAVTNSGTELVLLWRGRPGWYMKAGPRAEHASGNSESYSVSLEYPGTRLAMSYDRRRREATVGRKVQLLPAEANTIFVDQVDDPGGPTIVGFTTLRLLPTMTNASLADAFSHSPAAVAFLQCDEPWNAMSSFTDIAKVVCGQLRVQR